MSTECISIAFLGVDDRSKSAYRLFFESIKKIKYKIVDDYRDAQLCLVDKDSYKIKKQYAELIKGDSEQYILSTSIIEQVCAHSKEFYLQKPIKKELLQGKLIKISRLIINLDDDNIKSTFIDKSRKTVDKISVILKKDLTSLKSKNQSVPVLEEKGKINSTATNPAAKGIDNVISIDTTRKAATSNAGKLLKIKNEACYVGERPDVDVNNSEQLKAIFYSPNMLMQGIVEIACEKSKETEKIIQLNIFNHTFYFDHSEQKVYASAERAVIHPLCVMHHENEATYNVKHADFKNELHATLNKNRNGTAVKSLEDLTTNMDSFKWIVSLWCSRGRIPQGIDVTQPVYLRQWPNLTRLEMIPHSVQIAALLYEHPRTLIDVANQLGIEQRYVFAFFSACKSITLSDVSRREVDKLFVYEQQAEIKNKSILSKLLGRLAGPSDKSLLKKTLSNL